MELKKDPTGNGRRQNPFHKSYSRMTNTFFAKGTSKLEDMKESVNDVKDEMRQALLNRINSNLQE